MFINSWCNGYAYSWLRGKDLRRGASPLGNFRPPGYALVFPSFPMERSASNWCFYIASHSLREYSMFDTTVLGQKNGLSDFSHRPLSGSVYVYF